MHNASNVTGMQINEHSGNSEDKVAQGISSSTTAFVDEAFRYHDSSGTESSNIAAPHSYRQQNPNFMGSRHKGSQVRTNPNDQRDLFGQRRASQRLSDSAHTVLHACLPSLEAAKLLVDTYFDRVHWFTLLFHQDDFRTRFQELYDNLNGQSSIDDLGFLSTFLAVNAIGLQYLGEHRQALLLRLNMEAMTLKNKILTALEQSLLAILATASIEAVQTCVLLGTYYLYHGEPDLAWPVCGCGLRIAQALGLHERVDHDDPKQTQEQFRHAYEGKKRSWWAIYEIETYCSMLYGLPLSIRDTDCSVDHLDLYSKTRFGETSDPNLLTYKYSMSKLSIIVKAALLDLYGLRSTRSTGDIDTSKHSSYMEQTIKNVKTLNERLQQWKRELPLEFRAVDVVDQDRSTFSETELDKNIGATGPRFEQYILQLQILALKLAYENAKILINRPLLLWKVAKSPSKGPEKTQPSLMADPCLYSIRQCRDAALQISKTGSLPIFRQASQTYAVTYIDTHLFTAGVTLGIIASLNPMSQESHDSKLGLQRLVRMQASLQSRSGSTDQTLVILKRLIELVVKKELSHLVEPPQNLEVQEDHSHDPEGDHEDISAQAAIGDSDGDTSQIDLGEMDLSYVEDSEILQSLFGFDQGPAHSQMKNGIVASSLQPQLFGESALFEQEQGWIWGMTSFPEQS